MSTTLRQRVTGLCAVPINVAQLISHIACWLLLFAVSGLFPQKSFAEEKPVQPVMLPMEHLLKRLDDKQEWMFIPLADYRALMAAIKPKEATEATLDGARITTATITGHVRDDNIIDLTGTLIINAQGKGPHRIPLFTQKPTRLGAATCNGASAVFVQTKNGIDIIIPGNGEHQVTLDWGITLSPKKQSHQGQLPLPLAGAVSLVLDTHSAGSFAGSLFVADPEKEGRWRLVQGASAAIDVQWEPGRIGHDNAAVFGVSQIVQATVVDGPSPIRWVARLINRRGEMPENIIVTVPTGWQLTKPASKGILSMQEIGENQIRIRLAPGTNSFSCDGIRAQNAELALPAIQNAAYQGGIIMVPDTHASDIQTPLSWRRIENKDNYRRYAVPGPGNGVGLLIGQSKWGLDIRSSSSVELTGDGRPWTMIQNLEIADVGGHIGDLSIRVPTGWKVVSIDADQPWWIRQLAGGGELADLPNNAPFTVVPKSVDVRHMQLAVTLKRIDEQQSALMPVIIENVRSSSYRLSLLSTAQIETHIQTTAPWRMDTSDMQALPTGALRAELFATGIITPVTVTTTQIEPDVGIESVVYVVPGLRDDHWCRVDLRLRIRSGEVSSLTIDAPLITDPRLQIISDNMTRDTEVTGLTLRARVPMSGDHLIRLEGALQPEKFGVIPRIGMTIGNKTIPIRQVVVVQAPPQADLVLQAGDAALPLAADALPNWSRPLPGTPVSVAWRLSAGETGTYRLESRPLASAPSGFIDQLVARSQIDHSGTMTLISARVAAPTVQALPLYMPSDMQLVQATIDGHEVAVRRTATGNELPLPGRTQVQVVLLFSGPQVPTDGRLLLPLPRLGDLPSTATTWTVAVAGGWYATVIDDPKAISLLPEWLSNHRPWFSSWWEGPVAHHVPQLPAIAEMQIQQDARQLQTQVSNVQTVGEPQLLLRGHLFSGTRLGGETHINLQLTPISSLRTADHIGWVLAVLMAAFLTWQYHWLSRCAIGLSGLLCATALHEWHISAGPLLALSEWLAPLLVVSGVLWWLIRKSPRLAAASPVTALLLLSVTMHAGEGSNQPPQPVVPEIVLMGYDHVDEKGVPQDVRVALTKLALTNLWKRANGEDVTDTQPAVCDIATGTPRFELRYLDDHMEGTLSLAVAVPSKEWQQLRIPVIPGSVKKVSARALGNKDPGKLAWSSEGDGVLVLTLAPLQQADVVIDLEIQGKTQAGEWSSNIPIPGRVGGLLKITSALAVAPWLNNKIMLEEKGTWSASLPIGHNNFSLLLSKPPAVVARELHMGIEQQVNARLDHDRIEWQASVVCTTQGGSLRRLEMQVPTHLVLTSITGDGVADWTQAGDRVVVMSAHDQTGQWELSMAGVMAMSALPEQSSHLLITVAGAERSRGRLDLTAGAGLRFERPQAKTIERTDPIKGADQAVRWQADPGLVPVQWRAVDTMLEAHVRGVLGVGIDRVTVQAAIDLRGPGQRDVIRLLIPEPWQIVRVPPGLTLSWHNQDGKRSCALRGQKAWEAGNSLAIDLVAERRALGDIIQVPDIRPISQQDSLDIKSDRQTWLFSGAGDRRVRVLENEQQQQALHIEAAQKTIGNLARLNSGERWLQACSWRGAGAPQLQIAKDEVGVDVHASHYLVLAQDRVRWSAHIVYTVKQGELTTLRCTLPDKVTLSRVTANGLGNWTLTGRDLVVNLAGPTRQVTALDLELELPLTGNDVSISALTVIGGVGAQDVAFVTEDDLGLIHVDPQGLESITEKAVPFNCPVGIDMTAIRYRWRSQRPGWTLSVKRETLATSSGIDGVVTLVDAVTVLGVDGECRSRAVWQVLNRTRTHLHVRLPDGITLWETRVGGVDIRPRQGATPQDIIIPVTPQRPGESTQAVSLTWREQLNPAQRLRPSMPQFTELRVMQGLWRIVPPPGYSLTRHGGTLLPVDDVEAEACRAQSVIDELKRLRSLGDLDDVGLRRLNDQLVTLDLQLNDNLISLNQVENYGAQTKQQQVYNSQVISSVTGNRKELQQELERIDNVRASRSQRREKLGLSNPTQSWSVVEKKTDNTAIYAERTQLRVQDRPAKILAPGANLGAGQPPPGQRHDDHRTLLGLDLLGDPGVGGLSLKAQGNDLTMELSMTRTDGNAWPWLALALSVLSLIGGLWFTRRQ